jgi:hypothetical protein
MPIDYGDYPEAFKRNIHTLSNDKKPDGSPKFSRAQIVAIAFRARRSKRPKK